MKLRRMSARHWVSSAAPVIAIAAAAAALAAPVQWTGGRGPMQVKLYVDGQRATGGVLADTGNGVADLTLVGTGAGVRYSGAMGGTLKPTGGAAPQEVQGTWMATLSSPAPQVSIRISRIDGKPAARNVLLPLSGSSAPPPMRCGWARGDVTAQKPRATARPLRAGDPVGVGDIIRTGGGSAAIVVLGDRSVALMEELTTLTLPAGSENEGSSPQKVQANRGKIWFAVRKIGGGQRFEVETDEAVASVKGTEFLVEVQEDGEMSLLTAEGEVDVSNPTNPQEKPIPVTAGTRWNLARKAPGVVRAWRPAQKFDMTPVVQRWQPMLNLSDHLWIHRRQGKIGFWQDRIRVGAIPRTLFGAPPLGMLGSGSGLRLPGGGMRPQGAGPLGGAGGIRRPMGNPSGSGLPQGSRPNPPGQPPAGDGAVKRPGVPPGTGNAGQPALQGRGQPPNNLRGIPQRNHRKPVPPVKRPGQP